MRKPGPGKFEACEDIRLAELLYSMSLAGELEDEFGETAGPLGWYGFLIHGPYAYIMAEDDRGFFEYERLPRTEGGIKWQALRQAALLTDDIDVTVLNIGRI